MAVITKYGYSFEYIIYWISKKCCLQCSPKMLGFIAKKLSFVSFIVLFFRLVEVIYKIIAIIILTITVKHIIRKFLICWSWDEFFSLSELRTPNKVVKIIITIIILYLSTKIFYNFTHTEELLFLLKNNPTKADFRLNFNSGQVNLELKVNHKTFEKVLTLTYVFDYSWF